MDLIASARVLMKSSVKIPGPARRLHAWDMDGY